VLDIFGFEAFQVNSFEQLCINYANEKLHQQFVNFYFKAELAEYSSEGVDVGFISFGDNKKCLNLVEARPLGLLSLLHEECRLKNTTDRSLVAKLNHSLRGQTPNPKP
jgi:myosin-5